jgi:hypothetical protein
MVHFKFLGLTIDMNTLDYLNRPSQHISACSSLHQRNGALTLSRKQHRIILGMVDRKGKAYLFNAQTGRYIYRFWRY